MNIKMASTDNILGFPPRFNSVFLEQNKPNNVLFLLRRLWKNVKVSINIIDTNVYEYEISTKLDGKKIILPKIFPSDDYSDTSLVSYIQEILDLNNYRYYVVILHYQECYFEILPYFDFSIEMKYPIKQYRADRDLNGDNIPVVHPNIPHIWIYLHRRIADIFPCGNGGDFDKSSPFYSSFFKDDSDEN